MWKKAARVALTRYFWANGVALNKNFSVGVRATYLFSSIINQYTNTLPATVTPVVYSPTIYERTYIKDFNFSLGASFHEDSLFNKNYRFNVGAVYNFKSELNTEYYTRIERRNSAGGVADSTTLTNNNPGTIMLPQSFTVGLSFGKGEKWMIGADYSYLKNSLFRDYFGNSQNATDSWRIALGGRIYTRPNGIEWLFEKNDVPNRCES
jgi:long-subunit fatty acid transport protein